MTLLSVRTGRPRRAGFSVIELLIATTIAMVILLVVTKWFRDLSRETSKSRAMVEMSGQLRAVISQLESDLRNATFPRGAAPGTVAALGYIQYVEGMAGDASPAWQLSAGFPGVTVPNSLAIGGAGTLVNSAPAAAPVHFTNILGLPAPGVTSRFGDMDDVLCLTARSIETPYRGKILLPGGALTTSIESPMAEIVWWVEGYDENGDGVISEIERRLHRRVFLIRPDLSEMVNAVWRWLTVGQGLTQAQALEVMLQQMDVSFWVDSTTNNAYANSLADLSNPTNNSPPAPQCRRITTPASILAGMTPDNRLPHRAALQFLAFKKTLGNPALDSIGVNRYGEDVMLSSMAAFDIRIFDPYAPLWLHNTGAVCAPGDPGYAEASAAGVKAGQGAFVDLNYAHVRNPAPTALGVTSSWFSGPPSEFSGFFRTTNSGAQYTHLLTAYDTWAPLANDAFDGVDDGVHGSTGVIDDPEEIMREMAAGQYIMAPYPYPLRGLQVTLRVYDTNSRQVRQLKASASFAND